MTKGFLAPNGIFDWHNHKNIDEWFLVTQGTGTIEFEDGEKINYKEEDLIYIPANIKHRIENTGNIENGFFFIRVRN